jgi:ADP-ribose pyrophosphatase YjhB (NUDIX family)
LDWVRRLQAVAQNGVYYASNAFDRERFEEVGAIAAEIAAADGRPVEELAARFAEESGHACPKVDVRAAAFRDGRVLFVRGADDGLWTLPGGWAEVGESPRAAVEKELREESGFRGRAVKLVGAYERDGRDSRFKFRLFHGLTPETDTSCFYFWSVANGYRQNEPEATEQLYQEIAPTFVEDRVMVEAQQTRLTEFGEAGLVDIASDATRMQMRRIVDRLIAAEQAALAAE